MTKKETHLLEACKLGRKYLAKLVAEGLFTECVITPTYALRFIDKAIKKAQPNETNN